MSRYLRAFFAAILWMGLLQAAAPIPPAAKTLVVLGDSLSAGYGVDLPEAWPSVLQERIRSEGLDWAVVNAGVSGDTSAGGLRRLEWLLRRPVGALVLELGANDGLRGLSVEAMRTNLQAVIDRTRARWPGVRIVVAGMRLPANMGADYVERFEGLFPSLAATNGAALIPFLLEGVGGRPEYNQADQIHPNAEGHRRVATNVWSVVGPILKEASVGGMADKPVLPAKTAAP